MSLLAHTNMALKYRDEAFITFTFPINHVPSKVINHETPLKRLFHSKPKYSFLRIFGCACWPDLRPVMLESFNFV
jgi:histone deacetylase 1/2